MFGHVDKVSDRKKEAQKVWVPRKDLQPTVVDKGKSPVLAQKDSSSYASTSAIGFPVVLVQAPDSIVHLSAGTNSLGSVQSGDDLTSGVSINVESVQPDGGIAYVDTRHTHSSSVQTAAISAQLGANPLDSVQYGDDLVSGASINVVSVQPDDGLASVDTGHTLLLLLMLNLCCLVLLCRMFLCQILLILLLINLLYFLSLIRS
ncbi:hypothetical protein V6N11_043082 [Hibiscus sabdariffa]|uniref:Uncharacterized protein n=1 Tax=Hibiscus sabdariffa TaxID=183260 RepID=A0ABR2QY71_9ROSI